jgi:hypothetical protein
MLSGDQVNDIVLEVRRIFKHCVMLARELEAIVAEDKKAELKRKLDIACWYGLVLPFSVILLGFMIMRHFGSSG